MASTVVPYQQPNSLDIQSLIGIGLGKDTSNAFAMSAFGLAVRRPDGRYVAKDPAGDGWVDTVATFNFDPYVFRIPVSTIEKGNLVVNMDSPLDVMYVLETPKDSEARVLNLDSEIVTHTPTRNALFGAPLYVRVLSIFDFSGAGLLGGRGRGREPALTALLPFLLCCQKTDGTTTNGNGGMDIATILLLSQSMRGGGRSTEVGALLPFLLLGNCGNNNNALLPLLLMEGGLGGLGKGDMSSVLLLLAMSQGSCGVGNNNLIEAMLLMQGMGDKRSPRRK